MSTTKETLKRLIREALEEQQEDSVLLDRPKPLNEEESLLQTSFPEPKTPEDVKKIIKIAERLNTASLRMAYLALRRMLAEKRNPDQY